MNIVDQYSLPVSKHRLEDMFYPVLIGPVKKLYTEFITLKRGTIPEKGSEKQELLLKLLKFARRMNFSISDFPLP
jgi:hypothetical protein